MGWFDNEQGNEKRPPSPQPTREPASRPTPSKTPSPKPDDGEGSTLGRQIHVDGTIVCGEDLTILGKVEGTIRAKGTLTIAKEADVHAAIDGQRVLLHGKVEGDVEGAERVVLGPTARLDGNIQAPALEITEGAYFKGNVDMQPESADRESRKKKSPGEDEPARASATSGKEDKGSAGKEDKGSSGKEDKGSSGERGSSSADGGGSGDGSKEPKPAAAGKPKGAGTTASR